MTRYTRTRAAALLVASGGLFAALTQQPPQQPLTVEKLAADLHVIVGSGGNVAVLTTPEGVILVDDKFERNVPEIVEKVKSITPQPIRYVLNTHHHGDHSGGNASLMAASAEIVAHRNARANMVKGSQPGPPRFAFADEFSLHLGGKEVRAQHFGRGHTNGDAFIHFPSHRILHTGDMFVQGAPLIDYANGGSGAAWPATIARALELDFDTVIPGHGPIMKKSDLAAWKKSFETVHDRISQLRKEGKTREQALGAVKIDGLPGWAGPDRSWSSRSLPGLIDELAK